jgi:hypothetical protein
VTAPVMDTRRTVPINRRVLIAASSVDQTSPRGAVLTAADIL